MHSKFSLVGIGVHVVLVIPSMLLVSTKNCSKSRSTHYRQMLVLSLILKYKISNWDNKIMLCHEDTPTLSTDLYVLLYHLLPCYIQSCHTLISCCILSFHAIHSCQGICTLILSSCWLYCHTPTYYLISVYGILFQFMVYTITACKFEEKPLWVGTFLNEAQRQHDFMKNMNVK